MKLRTTAMHTVAVVAVLVGFFILWKIRMVLLLFVVAVLIAAAIEPVALFLRRVIGAKRSHSVLLVYMVMALIVALVIIVAQQSLSEELGNVLASYREIPAKWAERANQIRNTFFKDSALNLIHKLEFQMSDPGEIVTAQHALFLTQTAMETLIGIITVFVLSFYWIIEKQTTLHLILSFFAPGAKRTLANQLWNDTFDKLGSWVRGQLTLSLAMGILCLAAYAIFGVKHALLLAVWLAICEVLPMIGAYIGFAPAVLMAATQNAWLGGAILIFAVCAQLIESNFLAPKIMKHAIGFSPLTTILAMLSGAALFGWVGAILALPIAGTLQVLLEDWLEHQRLTEQEVLHKKILSTSSEEEVVPSPTLSPE